MIYDVIKYTSKYQGISPQMDRALALIKTTDFMALNPGNYPVDEEIYYNVIEGKPQEWEDTSWECHRAYIDIQYMLTEGEQIAVCPMEQVDGWSEYVEDGDYALSKEGVEYAMLPMGRGRFAVFFPQDAHRPTKAPGEWEKVKKVVIKVRV